MTAFIPLYWTGVLLQTQQKGGFMVTVMSLATAAATFVGGALADRFGFSRIIRAGFVTISPLIVLMLQTKNVWIAAMFIALAAAMLYLGHGPSVVLAQKYMPNQIGLASGVTMGLATSLGGVCSPILGKIGDSYGIETTLYVVAAVALIGFLSTLLIHKPDEPANDAVR